MTLYLCIQIAPVSERHILRNCSHWMLADQPDNVNHLIKDFCSRHPLKTE